MTLAPKPNLPLCRAEVAFLILLSICALSLRTYHLGAIGLADDEANKWLAIQQYKQGKFVGVNSEHPVMMKALAWGSYEVGQRWNKATAHYPQLQVSEEAWLRLPSAAFGAATAVAIFLLGKVLIGTVGGGAAALFWAFAPLSVAFTCILKEETLLTFFTVLAMYFYWSGRQASDDSQAKRSLDWSAVCFGLSFASKFVFHFLLFNFVASRVATNRGLIRHQFSKPFEPRFLAIVAIVAVLANPLVFSLAHDLSILHYPATWDVIRNGYNLGGTIYINKFTNTPYGVPWYFYLWVLAVKTPIPLLLAIAAGVAAVLWSRNSLPGVVLRVMIVFNLLVLSLVANKWMRYLVSTLPFLLLASGYVTQRIYEWIVRRASPAMVRVALAGAAVVLFAWPAAESLSWAPFYRLYMNSLGGGKANAARLFSPDELYDAGVREAIDYGCRVAPANSTLAVANAAASAYYAQRCGRRDLHIAWLFDGNYSVRPGDYIIVQDSRRYFETDELFQLVKRHGVPLERVTARGIPLATLYRY